MQKLILQIILGITALFLAVKYVPGTIFTGPFYILLIAGTVLGFLNFFIKPILNIITLPLRILTLGLFSFVINMSLVWLTKAIFLEIDIIGLSALFWTTFILWSLNIIFYLLP